MRLDRYLVEEGFAETRSKALQLIKEGRVKVDGRVVRKGGVQISPDRQVEVEGGFRYVGRGGYKLEGLLALHPLPLEGQLVLDVGSSTGGFTQVALERGARKVVAVDVGVGQLHPSLRRDPRVELFEGVDIRQFHYPERFPVVLSDVSFISLRKILPALARLVAPGGRLLLLFKPQFEVGVEAKRNSRGVVVDLEEVERARREFELTVEGLGWEIEGVYPSPVRGKEGNQEYGYFLRAPTEE